MNYNRKKNEISAPKLKDKEELLKFNFHKKVLVNYIVSLFAFWLVLDVHAQVVVPNLSIIGKRYDCITNLWMPSKASLLANQISLDYNSQGIISGLVCEYDLNTNIFQGLKASIQNELRVKPGVDTSDFYQWRSEERKITVMLDRSDRKVIRVIVVSVDKHIRQPSQ